MRGWPNKRSKLHDHMNKHVQSLEKVQISMTGLDKAGGTAAEVIARDLVDAGCKHAFGMPGGEVLALLDALETAGVEFTLCKHENAAGFMAEGSWHMTGAPGILLTTIGPGLANGVNSIANAMQEQVPLIVLSGRVTDAHAQQFTHQVMDQSALMAPITKASLTVAPGTAALVIAKALSIAMADPPGPVHIDLPDAIAAEQVDALPAPARVTSRGQWGDGPDRAAAIAKLRAARRPLVLTGLGALHHDAAPAIRRLCERHAIPLITTYKAKGVLPEDHPLALGGHGLSPLSDRTILPLLAASDCVILAGYDPIEMRAGWIRPFDADNAIEIMHARVEHGMHGSAIRFIGDVAGAVRALDDGLGTPLQDVWPDGEIDAARARLAADFAPRGRWGPHAVFDTLQGALPADAVVTVDSGAHRILFSQMMRVGRPGQLLQSSAFCTMGVAVPLAMGVKRADPTRPVVAVVGDAGFDMTAGDLATLRDMDLPLTILVLVDDALALIAKKQAAMQLQARSMGFARSDFVAIARAYGGNGKIASDVESLQDALQGAWSAHRFSVIACPIAREEYDGAF